MLTMIYQGIIALMLTCVVWCLFTEKKLTLQINCALVIIPLLLRMLLIK